MRFIDLFAGLGGFHLALKALGHRCVFACEVNDELASLYEKNFGLRPFGDVRSLDTSSLPAHDILCAGFPCQPFSKAGGQQGFECPQWGDLIDYVIRILRLHKPPYFIIENVPNLVRHRDRKNLENNQAPPASRGIQRPGPAIVTTSFWRSTDSRTRVYCWSSRRAEGVLVAATRRAAAPFDTFGA